MIGESREQHRKFTSAINTILGLADVALRKKAAEAISNGLRMGGNFKVLFFITENRGRVSQQDTTTLKLVLDAAPEIREKYGIIVNMVSKKVLQKLEKESAYHYFNDLIFAGIDEKNRCSFNNIIFQYSVGCIPKNSTNIII